MLILQIISATLLLLNKFYVQKKNVIGWAYGILGTIAIALYFYFQMIVQHKTNLWIMVMFNIVLVPLMSYGYFVARTKKDSLWAKRLRKYNVPFKFLVMVITISVCSVFLVKAIVSQLIILQFIFACTLLFGTLLLAFDTNLTNIAGWILYFIGPCILTYVMIKTDSYIIAILQVMSAGIAIKGIYNETKILK